MDGPFKLDLQEYCDGCQAFEAESTFINVYGNDQVVMKQWIITCEKKKICEQICKFLERKYKNDIK